MRCSQLTMVEFLQRRIKNRKRNKTFKTSDNSTTTSQLVIEKKKMKVGNCKHSGTEIHVRTRTWTKERNLQKNKKNGNTALNPDNRDVPKELRCQPFVPQFPGLVLPVSFREAPPPCAGFRDGQIKIDWWSSATVDAGASKSSCFVGVRRTGRKALHVQFNYGLGLLFSFFRWSEWFDEYAHS